MDHTSTLTARVGAVLHSAAWQRRTTSTVLGAAMGVSQSVASKKLRGLTPITVEELGGACDLLGVSPSWVLEQAAAGALPRVDSNHEPAGYRLEAAQ